MCQKQPTPKYTSVRSLAAPALAGWGFATSDAAAGRPKAKEAAVVAAEVRKFRRPAVAAATSDFSTFAAAPESDALALYADTDAALAARRERRADIFVMVVMSSSCYAGGCTSSYSTYG